MPHATKVTKLIVSLGKLYNFDFMNFKACKSWARKIPKIRTFVLPVILLRAQLTHQLVQVVISEGNIH